MDSQKTVFKSKRRQRFKVPRKSASAKVPEWLVQAWVISELHKAEASGEPITCAGDFNAGRRGFQAAARAKVTGLTAGEPDVRVYLPRGRLGSIEIKTGSGRVSPAQRDRHARLRDLGHTVELIQTDLEAEARGAARALLGKWLEREL